MFKVQKNIGIYDDCVGGGAEDDDDDEAAASGPTGGAALSNLKTEQTGCQRRGASITQRTKRKGLQVRGRKDIESILGSADGSVWDLRMPVHLLDVGLACDENGSDENFHTIRTGSRRVVTEMLEHELIWNICSSRVARRNCFTIPARD